jgi:hypothetical protein
MTALLVAGVHLFGGQLCLFRKYTGVPCMVCGSSRAVELLLRGCVEAAFRLQPLATVVAVAAVVLLPIHWFSVFIMRRRLMVCLNRFEKRLLLSIVVLLLLLNWGYLIVNSVV